LKPRPRVRTRHTRHGIELRIDGTLASIFKPGQASAGPVWDALAAPLVALPPHRRRRVLILGIGGGSVVRLARALSPSAEIVGVDNDREVLRVARRELGLGRLDLEIVIDDALRYLRRERRTFDLVIEDLMIGTAQRPRKPEGLVEGYDLVRKRVARGGLLSVNTIHETPQLAARLNDGTGTLLSVAVKDHYNHILVSGPTSLKASSLRRAMAESPVLSHSLPALQVRTLRR
jgi:spermidine synthase